MCTWIVSFPINGKHSELKRNRIDNDLDHSFTWFWLVRRAEIFITSFPPQPCHLRNSAVYYCHKTRMWSYIYIYILIRFKCNLPSVSEYVVCANGHLSSIQDHESPMIIQGEYKVHLLNNKKRRNACLSCSSMICENISYIFPYTYFSYYLSGSQWIRYHFQQSWPW